MHPLELSSKAYPTKVTNRQELKHETKQLLPVFDLRLITSLEDDHEEIINLYNKVLKSAENKEYAVLQLSLVEFATSLTDHIQVEDELFYGYLKVLAKNKSHLEQKIVSDFSSEMKNISISIFSFLTQSPFIPVNETNNDTFIEEFKKIGLLLQDRIEREEKVLYPIYKNSRKMMNIS